MMEHIDLGKLTPAEQIVGEDAEETGRLQGMLRDATNYLRGFRWCPPIDRVYLGCGVGGVVAVFLFHFSERIQGTDEWLWVVVGDLPEAYFVIDDAGDPASALEVYCGLMDGWAKAVLEGKPLDDVFPVEAEPTADNARLLLKRLNFIRTRLLPGWRTNCPKRDRGQFPFEGTD
jgi:hypothetical protein